MKKVKGNKKSKVNKVISNLRNNFKKVIGKRTDEEEEKLNALIDCDFIEKVGPHLGLSFNHEKYISCGDTYAACLYVHKYPKEIEGHWLNTLANIPDTIAVFDVASLNTLDIKKNLHHSMEEQSSRVSSARSTSQLIDAQRQYSETVAMYKEVEFGNVMKAVISRIYIPARTMVECDIKAGEVINQLEGSGYRAGICIDETKQDYRNVFLPYNKQQNTLYARKGQAMLSTTFAIGNPFHFTKLSDEYGTYYGTTVTGGSVLLDLFKRTNQRMSYNGVVFGMMGSGKSTLLKKMLMDRASQGDIVRVFDITGEFKTLTNWLGGKVISLDGQSNNIINALQILKTGDDDMSSYNMHISKIATIYKYLKPDVGSNEILILKKLLRLLYVHWGIIANNGNVIRNVSTMTPQDFPIWSDFLEFIKNGLLNKEEIQNSFSENMEEETDRIDFSEIRESLENYVENIILVIEDLCLSYGNIFNGHTSIDDFYSEQVVCFDVSKLKSLEEHIFDAQLFNALSLCWDNCVSVGSEMKYMYDHKEIQWEDITRFLILIDEAHRIVNANKMAGVEQIERFEREARKYFGGIIMASQSIRDFVPENSDTSAAEKLKILFELSTYKWVLKQDANCRPLFNTIFNGEFTAHDLDQIPKLGKGETLLSIPGENTIEFSIECQQFELDKFEGGA